MVLYTSTVKLALTTHVVQASHLTDKKRGMRDTTTHTVAMRVLQTDDPFVYVLWR